MMNFKKITREFHSTADNSGLKPPKPQFYKLAEEAYIDMVKYQKNQSIIISGESGAGKTEACKRILK